MALASSLRKIASKLTSKFGGDATIRIVTVGAYNASTGVIAETTADVSIKGVLDAVNAREVNELVQASDKKLMIAATDLALAPSTADKVLISNVTHDIIKVQIIEQDNTAIVYELILRA